MPVLGKGCYAFLGHGSTYKGGDRSVDKHIPLNPMDETITFPSEMKYTIEKVTTCNKMFPNIEYDTRLEPGTIRLRCYFKDPIVLANGFGYKGLPSSWTGASDVMTFNFSNYNNQDKNLWLQVHLHDNSGSSNHLDFFADGGKITSYSFIIEAGRPIMEEIEIQFAEINVATDTDSTGAYVCDIDDGFDDGSFDQAGVAEVSTITAKAANDMTNNTYFFIWLANGTGGWTKYHVWFNKDAGGTDPAPAGSTAIEVAITTDQTAGTVATAIGAALDGAHANFGTPVVADSLVTVTQQQTGDIKDVVDYNSGLTLATTTQGKNALDGGWSNWDGAYSTKQCAMSVNTTITYNNASLDNISIQKLTFDIKLPNEQYWDVSSLTAKDAYLQPRAPYTASVDGIIEKGNDNLAEPTKTIANKTSATIKAQYGTTKYLQFTNGRIEDGSVPGTKAGNAPGSNLNIVAGADSVLTFSWTASEATDPSGLITHTDV